MKLYTEEEIKRLLKEQIIFDDEDFDKLTSIELPSDEEIEKASTDKINILNDCFGQYDFTSGQKDGFIEGAYWMRNKIQGGNK